MSIPRDVTLETDLAIAPSLSGNLPGTDHTGLIYLEYANIERKSGAVWSVIASNVPATFEKVETEGRLRLETWSHKPLFSVWLPPSAAIVDGDRIVRCDGTRWYVRGSALVSPERTHIVALVEASAEDGLFAARSASEPS